MAKGLPRSIVKKYGVSKRAWAVYRASKNRKVNKTRSTKSKPVRKLARRRSYTRKRRKRRTRTIPLAPLLGVAAGAVQRTRHNPSWIGAYIRTGNWEAAFNQLTTNFTGYTPQKGTWDWKDAHALQGLIIGLLAHKAVGWLGGHRIFANLPSPLNKVRI